MIEQGALNEFQWLKEYKNKYKGERCFIICNGPSLTQEDYIKLKDEYTIGMNMIFNWFEWVRDDKSIPRIHPAQKPVNVLKRLISIFTDEGDVVIDPCAGSGTTLRAAKELGRNSYGFEVSKEFYAQSQEKMLYNIKPSIENGKKVARLF